jgi:translation initiation factor 2-alpha kinase 3
MFRRPGEESSSSSEGSDEHTEDEVTSASHQDSVLSRIQTLDSADSAPSTKRPTPPRFEMRQNSTQNVRDLMLHALLEEKAIGEAAQKLGKDKSDPDVQRMGREAYQELARQIANNVDDMYAAEDMRNHRITAQEGISKLTRNNLSRLAAVPEGDALSQALIGRAVNGLSMQIPQQPSVGFEVLSGISAPTELQLRGYPGLQTDRYAREFSELEIVGRGGYGKVFKAKHKLDGFFYAVKRIPVSPAKLAKIQKDGSDDLESILQEVRSLARFDHTNIVRYHNAWLEFTTAPRDESVLPASVLPPPNRLLEDVTTVSTTHDDMLARLDNLSFGEPFATLDDSHGAGIVFETSDNALGAETSKSETDNLSYKAQLSKSSRQRNRRDSQASQATIATISSSMSRMSVVEDVDEDDEEEEIETIPRSHMPHKLQSDSAVTESMVTHSDIPQHLVSLRNAGPILTLNVQMSLCETSLAAFLSAERSSTIAELLDRHCFHPCVSLEILWNIISGVEYLHAQGVVHRDLKPANVFLSLSTARHPPYGSVDVSTCKLCPNRASLHITPRIGDFGLVAALDDSCLDLSTVSKPVGTEYYRPEVSSKINDKLDVFAMGVMSFEMLQKFETRMERAAALTNLRRGIFPEDFARNLGPQGDKVLDLISNMVHADEYKRWSCEEVKTMMKELVHALRVE